MFFCTDLIWSVPHLNGGIHWPGCIHLYLICSYFNTLCVILSTLFKLSYVQVSLFPSRENTLISHTNLKCHAFHIYLHLHSSFIAGVFPYVVIYGRTPASF